MFRQPDQSDYSQHSFMAAHKMVTKCSFSEAAERGKFVYLNVVTKD